MKRPKKLISLTIALVIIISSVPFSLVWASQYENSGMEFLDKTTDGTNLYNQIKNSLPKTPTGGTPPQCLGDLYPSGDTRYKTMYINYRLWKDKGILVYGNYLSVPGNHSSDAVKDFKTGTQTSPGVVLRGVNDGYYSNPYGDQNRGEWRYHGYDISGNPFSNINFIDDGSGTKFNERDWIKAPWDNIHNGNRPLKSTYNDAVTNSKYNSFVRSHTQTWIGNSLTGGIPLPGGKTDPEVYQYLNVLSAPTPLTLGQGRMWHQKDDGSIWYQTLTVSQVHKDNLDVTTTITPIASLSVQDLGESMDNTPVNLQLKVTATLNDSDIYIDPVKKTVYYTRDDIKNWKLILNDPATQAQTGMTSETVAVPTDGNKGIRIFTFKTTYGFLRSHNWTLHFTAAGQPLYNDNTWGNTDNASYDYDVTVAPPPLPLQQDIVISFSPNPDIPEIAFDGVPFSAIDNTDMSKVTARRVYVDGVQVDDNNFFSGHYVFLGDVGVNGRFAYVDCEYDMVGLDLPEGVQVKTRDIVYIYPTKPIANFSITSNTWKQNRLITVQDTSAAGNIQLVTQNFPIVSYKWSFDGDISQLRKGTDTDTIKQLMYKQPGIYSVTLQVQNTLGKWSDPYTVEFQVLQDIAPAVGVNLSDSVTTRGQSIGAWYYNIASTDGDVIKSSSIELWYDSNNDGTVDTKLNTWNNTSQFPSYTPDKLGYYKYILKANEDIVGDTLPQFITDADKKSTTYEVEFWVDNYQPMADLYVNIPIQRPSIDVYFMLDKNLDPTKVTYMLNNRINIANSLIGSNIIPNVNIWDMHSYTYSQPASTSVHTGGSYPSSTTTYSSNGYSGTLSLSSVSNNRYSRDEGHYETHTESKSVSQYATNTNSVTYRWTGTSWSIFSKNEPQLPSTRSYSDSDGYIGTLNKGSGFITGESGSPPSNPHVGDTYTLYTYWGVYYTGTVSRTVTVWVPNIVWYNDYTGFYNGTIYKSVRQPYTDPFTTTNDKYVVYISDGTVSELSDLQMVKSMATSKLILAGTPAIKSQISYDVYFDSTGLTIDSLVNSIFGYISDSSLAVEKYIILQNTSFPLNVGAIDLENDPIVEQDMQYVQDQTYFDNPTGTEPGAVSAYSDVSGWTSAVKNSFANVGKYTIYRRVKDKPSDDPNFSQYSYYSSSTKVEIYVHRKPIALASLDWDYDPIKSTYKTTWVDNSYDLDHQYNRPDKGIVDRKIMYRQVGGDWIYSIPDNLSPGSYELQYYVKDPEGAWSDPFLLNFTLNPTPAMQFDASLRTLDNSFSLLGIPASEYLETYNVWTRYPYNVNFQMALYKGATMVTPLKTVNYSTSTGTKDGNDINWNNVPYQLPETLSDGSYILRVSAYGDYGQNAYKDFPVTINTPINLKGYINNAASNAGIQTDLMNTFTFTTSKYVSSVKLVFKGQTYTSDSGMISLKSSDGSTKTWEIKLNVPLNTVTDNENGNASFTAWTPSGKSETVNVNYKVVAIQAYDFTITSILDISWRGYYFDLANPINGNGEKYGYPKKPNTDMKTVQMPVNSLGLVSYTRNSVKAGCRIKGYIRVKGNPDSVDLKARYISSSVSKLSNVSLTYDGSDKYTFDWIILQNTDTDSFVGFDVEIHKGSTVYGNEKWVDTWAQGNSSHWVLLVKGNVLDDILFNQSN